MMKRASSQEKFSSCKPQQTKSSRFGARELSIRAEESDISSEPIRSFPGFNLMNLPLNAPVQARMIAGHVCEECEQEGEEGDEEQPAVLQRQADPEIEEDEDEDEVLQGKFESSGVAVKPEQAEPRPNRTGMPDRLKAGIESLSGIDMSDVRLHANSDKPARLNALAYTQGNQIYLGPGQERHLAHEAWHAVQQKQGRVRATKNMMGVGVNDEAGLEGEATEMGSYAKLTQAVARQGFGPNSSALTPSEKAHVAQFVGKDYNYYLNEAKRAVPTEEEADKIERAANAYRLGTRNAVAMDPKHKIYLGRLRDTQKKTADKPGRPQSRVLNAANWNLAQNFAFMDGGRKGNADFRLATRLPQGVIDSIKKKPPVSGNAFIEQVKKERKPPLWTGGDHNEGCSVLALEIAWLIDQGYQMQVSARRNQAHQETKGPKIKMARKKRN